MSSARNLSEDRMFSEEGHESEFVEEQHESTTNSDRFVFFIFLNEYDRVEHSSRSVFVP